MPVSEPSHATVERVQFPAGPYQLEGELAYADDADTLVGGIIIAGSHPLLGGNMHNNVVRGLGDGLAERGWATLRFNYRGVGGSEGPRVDVARHMAEFWETSHVSGEHDLWQDVQAGAEFLRSILVSKRPLVLIGYSFGCSLLPSICSAGAPAALVLIAPPLSKHDYSDYATIRSPLLVILSSDDFTVEPARVREWFDPLPAPKELIQAKLDNHFFRGHEAWLVETVVRFLQEHAR